MKKAFYDREKEVALLRATREKSKTSHSMMTVLTGRRRIGKTSLGRQILSDDVGIYLFVGRKDEALLCEEFEETIRMVLPDFPVGQRKFGNLFRSLMVAGKSQPFTLFIDEFQDFRYVNPSVFSDVQNCWDQYRKDSHINLILSGSVHTMMNRIFRDEKEPLFGRADNSIRLNPFPTKVIKEMLSDAKADYVNEDLLALYAYSGGIPKYMELLLDNDCTDKDTIINYVTRENSMFIDEGRNLLIQEFGKHYETYFTILSLMATGELTQSDIQGRMGGDRNIGGFLKKLEEEYDLIEKKRPIRAKPGSQTVRYEIKDIFLRFWFRYMEKHRTLIEIGNYERLRQIVASDYERYSGKVLERWFMAKLQESQQYDEIGGWWLPDQNDPKEIDIVTVDGQGKVTAYEVKRQRKKYNPALLKDKVEVMQAKNFHHQSNDMGSLTIEDM